MEFLKNLFSKKKSDEKATVRLSSFSRWIDLQYKTILDPILLRIQTNEESLQNHVSALKEKLADFQGSKFTEQKAHIHKLVEDYAKRFSRDVSDFVDFLDTQEFNSGLIKSHEMYSSIEQKVNKLIEANKKHEHVLYKYFHQHFKHVVTVLEKIQHNCTQYSDIVDHETVKSYLQVKAKLSSYFEKKTKKAHLNEKKKKLIRSFDEQSILFEKFNKKAKSILDDPKYKIEKEKHLKPAYYELEYKDYDSKRVQVRKKCLSLKQEIDEIHAQILGLDLKKTIEQVQRQILDEIKIEVEVLED